MAKAVGFIFNEEGDRVALFRITEDLEGVTAELGQGVDPAEALSAKLDELLGVPLEPTMWEHFFTEKSPFDHNLMFSVRLPREDFTMLATLASSGGCRIWPVSNILQLVGNLRDKNPGAPRDYFWMIPLALVHTNSHNPVLREEKFDLDALMVDAD